MDDSETSARERRKYDDPVAFEGGPISEEDLRAIADEVRAAFPRPLTEPELVLIDVDPRHLHAFWNLPLARLEDTRKALPATEETNAPMVLRVSHDDGDEPFDVEVQGLQGQVYVDIWDDHRTYRGTLGLRLADGSLAVLIEGGTATLPPSGPVAQPAKALTVQSPAYGKIARQGAGTAAAGKARVLTAQPMVEAVAAVPHFEPGDREPLVEPFPPPPTEAGPFDPALLTGARQSDDGAPAGGDGGQPAGNGGPPAGEGGPSTVEESGPSPAEGSTAGAEAPWPTAATAEGGHVPLELENALTLSSFVLGRENVQLEVNAELRVFGRTRPGSELRLFGRRVTVRPDGTFSITRPLPNGALVLTALLVGGDDE